MKSAQPDELHVAKDPARRLHAKVQVVTLTAEGDKTFRDAYGEVGVLERELSRAFTAKERTALIDLLQRATDVLVAQTGASAAR